MLQLQASTSPEALSLSAITALIPPVQSWLLQPTQSHRVHTAFSSLPFRVNNPLVSATESTYKKLILSLRDFYNFLIALGWVWDLFMSYSAFQRLTWRRFSQVPPLGLQWTYFSMTYNEQLVQMLLLWLERNVKWTTAFAKLLTSKISTLERRDSDTHHI